MLKKKAMKGSGSATLASIKKEMAEPRVAKSARKKYSNLGSSVLLTKAGKSPSYPAGGNNAKVKRNKKKTGEMICEPYI